MAITVGALRDFCRERASSDNADVTAAREFMGWINSALDKLYKTVTWDRTITEQKLTIVPRESVTDLVVTQGSLALASATGFLQKYVDNRWELAINGFTRGTFELASLAVGLKSGTLRTGDEWTPASAVGVTCYFLNTRFPLPKVKEVYRVQLIDSGVIIRVLTPTEFDYLKQVDPLSQGSDPRYCTWRQGFLEVWPSPGTNYRKMSISYQREFTRILDTALDADVVDWDEENQDVLEKAILVQASITQGENSPISFNMAKQEFMDSLALAKGYSQRNNLTGPMGDPSRSKLTYMREGWWWGEVRDA